MASAATFTIALDSRLAVWGIRLAGFLAPLIGPRAAVALANLALRLLRYRIGKGRWQPLTGIRLEYADAIEKGEDEVTSPQQITEWDGTPPVQFVPETDSSERMHVMDETCWCRPDPGIYSTSEGEMPALTHRLDTRIDRSAD